MDIYQHLADEATVSLATQKRDGSQILTPLWLAGHDGKLYMRTIKGSAKVLRITNFPKVSLAACTWEGDITGQRHDAVARLMSADESLISAAEVALQAKYGAERTKMTLMMAQQGTALCYLELSLMD
jgi:uncharacterized protein